MNPLARPAPRSLRQMLTRAVVNSVVVTVGFGASFAAVSAMPANMEMPGNGRGVESVERPAAEGSPADLIEKHGCWQGEAPASMQGKMPGHVVVRYEGDVSASYRGAKAVGDALDFIFEGAENGVVEVVGFCR